ncbi:hypothetical protein F5141DRAFT_1061843 [Pisolithus sp. B1]|nr:hypothetical protein F5141DRAFT_1061843 [Pisolithus sp. B1]
MEVEESDSSHQGPTNMKLWMNAVLEKFRHGLSSELVAGTIGNTDTVITDANILASARQESSTHGIGSMDAKFTSVQVPQFKSDLRGGAVDIVAVTVGDAVLVSEGSATRPVAR